MAPLDIRRLLPARTLAMLAAGAILALALLLGGLLPQYREAETLRRQVAELSATLEARRQLAPVAKALAEAQVPSPPEVEVRGGERLSLAEVGRLATIFDAMATPHGLRVSTVSPEPSSATRNGLLAVRLGLTGDAAAFRDFLLDLGRYGSLSAVESVSTTAGRDAREYAVKFWLAVQ